MLRRSFRTKQINNENCCSECDDASVRFTVTVTGLEQEEVVVVVSRKWGQDEKSCDTRN